MKIIALIIGFIALFIYLIFNQDKSWKEKLMEWALNNGLYPNKSLMNLPSFSGVINGYLCTIELYSLGFGTEITFLNTRVDIFFKEVSNRLIVKILNGDKIPKNEFSHLDRYGIDSLLRLFNS